MAKLFAITIVVIAILSAIPIVRHTWHQPEDISTHGQQIDEQMSETMAEAGLAFLAAQIILAAFIWKFSNPKPGTKIRNFPGGARSDGDCGIHPGRERRFWRWVRSEQKPGRMSFSRQLPRMLFPCRCKLGSSPSISAIPGRITHSARFTRR